METLRALCAPDAEMCQYPNGARVLCFAMLDLRDGLIVKQTAVQKWDE